MNKKRVTESVGSDIVQVSNEREWSGEPTPDSDFKCYCSSYKTKEDAEQVVKALKKKKAWFEFNEATGKYVVKFAK